MSNIAISTQARQNLAAFQMISDQIDAVDTTVDRASE